MAEPMAFDAVERFDLRGRSVLITGAAHGLGLAVATAFVGAGAKVGAFDIDGDALGQVESALTERGVAITRTVDVRDWDACEAAVQDVADSLGGIDVLVNDAAIFPTGPLAEVDHEEYSNALDINVHGYVRMIKASLPHLRASGRGRIINFGSITFFMGYPAGLGAYISTKGAVVGMSRALAREVGPDGITVNVIAPGAFPTRAEDGIFDDREAYDREVIGHQALKRRGSVSDIASTAMFLASDAASFITGQTIVVDGGWMFD
jgi:3-oxoacyl-[acyl-carrier protein] reductase